MDTSSYFMTELQYRQENIDLERREISILNIHLPGVKYLYHKFSMLLTDS